jgi:hypothetical protein
MERREMLETPGQMIAIIASVEKLELLLAPRDSVETFLY